MNKEEIIEKEKREDKDLKDLFDVKISTWTALDVMIGAEEHLGITLLKPSCIAIAEKLAENVDSSIGFSWDDIYCAVGDYVEENNINF